MVAESPGFSAYVAKRFKLRWHEKARHDMCLLFTCMVFPRRGEKDEFAHSGLIVYIVFPTALPRCVASVSELVSEQVFSEALFCF